MHKPSSTQLSTKIGFIGLGHMGNPMALNLIKAGHTVTGFDVQPQAIEAFIDAGGLGATTLKDCALQQNIIITMLQTGKQVKQVCLGEQGLFTHATPGAMFIDCSSIDVQSSRDLHQQAEQYGLVYIDAPVSGGVAGASGGTLTFMVGGTSSAFELVQPILRAMGTTVIHTGDAGSGQAAKICNNMILGSTMVAVAEAFILAKHLGLTAQKLFDVVTHASGQCWVMNHYVPVPGILDNVPANRDYQPGFTTAMMLKDLKLSQHSAEIAQIKTPLAEQTTSLYQQLYDKNMGQLDFSAIIKLIDAE